MGLASSSTALIAKGMEMCYGVYEAGWDGVANIAICGLENSGKTSLCLQLRRSEERPRPTGMEDCLKVNQMSSMRVNEWVLKVGQNQRVLHVHDLGGKPEFHMMWTKRFINVLCVVFVIDASEPQIFHTNVITTYKKFILPHLLATRVPILFVLTKNDLVGEGRKMVAGVTPAMLKEGLGLEKEETAPDQYDIVETSSLTKEGIPELLDSAVKLLQDFKKKVE